MGFTKAKIYANPKNYLLVGIGAGLLSSWLKSLAEPPLEELGLVIFPTGEEKLKLKGADLLDHPQNMHPAIMIKKAFHKITGKQLKESAAIKTMLYSLHLGNYDCYFLCIRTL